MKTYRYQVTGYTASNVDDNTGIAYVSSANAVAHSQTIEGAAVILEQLASKHPECVHFGVTRGTFLAAKECDQ